MIQNRLHKLRTLMKEHGLQAYIVCTDDFHGSEYVGEYFKARAFLSGFTGSAGTLVVLEEEAALWTDGRYFLQAAKQLSGSGITLMKTGEPNVCTIGAYLHEKLGEQSAAGFDGRVTMMSFVEKLEKETAKKAIRFVGDFDLVGEIWQDRPTLSKEPVWELPQKYAGVARKEKLAALSGKLRETGADYLVLTSLDEIAWLLNLRGNDIACNPVFLSFLLMGKKETMLYVQKESIGEELVKRLAEDGIECKDYQDIYGDIRKLSGQGKLLLDFGKASYSIVNSVPKELTLIDYPSPVASMKAVKNRTECENIKRAHVKDGVAVTKFMYWLKKNIGTLSITEISAAEKLEEFRSSQEGYLGASFEPIMAYAAHGAIVHYSATEDSNIPLAAEGFFLSDTGGQYLEGTTDITRTYALGKLTAEEKRDYTLVLVGNLRLAAAKFLYGVRGVNLDCIARQPLWEYGLDYNHGTGHGVGYLLSVHEGPNAFRWRILPDMEQNAVFEEGMVTSDEPGVYIAGKFGVRLENLLLCKKAENAENGQFMCFEHLTLVPFDLEAVDVKYMSDKDVELLNAYHKKVYDGISPYMTEKEREWLGRVTAPCNKYAYRTTMQE